MQRIAWQKRLFMEANCKSPREIALDQRRFSAGQEYIERYLVARPFIVDEEYEDKFRAAGAIYISNREFFYRDGYRLYTRDGGQLLSYDGRHLSLEGAREFGEFLGQRYPLWDGSAGSCAAPQFEQIVARLAGSDRYNPACQGGLPPICPSGI
jgi:hypothetical protein